MLAAQFLLRHSERLEVEAGLDPVKALDTTSEEFVMNCRAKMYLNYCSDNRSFALLKMT
jgi:hypothetical protein